ncbi:MAG TPA: hypothetical protein VKU01_17530 [Bryobacteraceae bacterium]|nr:hypothetical protein [Bryobacteraceae bacterium]
MELLDRYLNAVKPFLPKKQQDDIIKELSENILSRVEDKEADLGRPLTEDEQVELLNSYGHPMLLAMRYRPQHSLIGPTVFPFYCFAILIALAITAVFYVLGILTLAGQGASAKQIIDAALQFPHAALPAVGWVTILFAAAELWLSKSHFLEKLAAKWNARSLPPVKRQVERVPRSQSITELISYVFALWWLAGLRYSYLIFGAMPFPIAFAPVWYTLYIPILLLTLLSAIQPAINLVHPEWTLLRRVFRLVSTAASVIVCRILLNADELIVTGGFSAAQKPILDLINLSMRIGVAIALIITAIQFVVEAVKLIRKLIQNRGLRAALSGVF